MKRLTYTGVWLSIVAAGSSGAFAQDRPTDAPGSTVTLVGCVQRTDQPGTLGTTIPERTAATPEQAGVLANLGEPGRGFILADATPASADTKPAPASRDSKTEQPKRYVLVGADDQFAKHEGHRVRVNGTIAAAPAANPAGTAGTSGPNALKSNTPRVQVSAMEMIAGDCGQQKKR
jgi:hypothetical protein